MGKLTFSRELRTNSHRLVLALRTQALVVEPFLNLMASNEFQSVGAVLADGFVLERPQSNERIRGTNNLPL
jgi:hypothetical protein